MKPFNHMRKLVNKGKFLFLLVLLLPAMVQGEVVVDTLRPVGDNFTSVGQWPQNTGTTRWEAIDEAWSDGDTTFLSEANEIGSTYACIMENYTRTLTNEGYPGGDHIDSVQFHVVNKRSALSPIVSLIMGWNSEGILAACNGARDTIGMSTSWTERFVTYTSDACFEDVWYKNTLNNDDRGFGVFYESGGSISIAQITQAFLVVFTTLAEPSAGQIFIFGSLDDNESFHRPCLSRLTVRK